MKRKLFLISIFLVSVYSLSAVCAAEVNGTGDSMEVSDADISCVSMEVNDELSCADDSCDGLNDSGNVEDNSILASDDSSGSCLESSDDEVILGTGEVKKYDDIHNTRRHQSEVNLYISDSSQLNYLFKLLNENTLSWGLLNITLAPDTVFNVQPYYFDDYNCYYMRLNLPLVVINGNHGSVIKGDLTKYNKLDHTFAYVPATSNLGINNVAFEGFNRGFVNSGNLFCVNSTFSNMNNVILNYMSSSFQSCTFRNCKGEACILHAKEGSICGLYCCKCENCGDCFIVAEKFSNVITHSDVGYINADQYHSCKFDSFSFFSPINLKKGFRITDNVTVINIEDDDDFYGFIMYALSTALPRSKIIVNMKPMVYNITSRDTQSSHMPGISNGSNTKKNLYAGNWHSDLFYYCMKVDFGQITVNGNGATLKLNYGDKNLREVFATVGSLGKLVLNDLTLTGFNHLFYNFGTLVANNCNFIDNQGYAICPDGSLSGAGILFSENGNSYFTNCTFRNDGIKNALFDIKNSKLYVKDCDFELIHYSRESLGSMGSIVNSHVYCQKQLRNAFSAYENSYNTCYWHDIDDVVVDGKTFSPDDVLKVDVVSSYYEYGLVDAYSKFHATVMILNVQCDCTVNLDKYRELKQLIIMGNGHYIKFKDGSVIRNGFSVTLNDVDLGDGHDCQFDNRGRLTFNNCNINGSYYFKYIVSNSGLCKFENCRFEDITSNKYLIYNEGCLLVNNCSFKDIVFYEGSTIAGHPIIYNKGIAAVNNVKSPWDYQINWISHCDTLNGFLLNSPDLEHSFSISKNSDKRIDKENVMANIISRNYYESFLDVQLATGSFNVNSVSHNNKMVETQLLFAPLSVLIDVMGVSVPSYSPFVDDILPDKCAGGNLTYKTLTC